jgi:hypothetical protein
LLLRYDFFIKHTLGKANSANVPLRHPNYQLREEDDQFLPSLHFKLEPHLATGVVAVQSPTNSKLGMQGTLKKGELRFKGSC